jgi:glycosyltransferase involved in cell wall biosynthesis
MTPLLSILICHIPERYDFLKRLSGILDPQLEKHKLTVECLIDDSRYKKIGRKRNDLMARAAGKYVCFIDDDDRVSDNYIELLLHGIRKDVDCCSLKGIITEDGENPLIFEHSIKYNEYRTNPTATPVTYERYPNHLNVIRASIAKQFPFPEINHGEDTDFATQVFKSGLIKTEHYIDQVIYYYDYRRK